KSQRQTKSELFHLHYAPAANVMSVIKPRLSAEGLATVTAAANKGIESGSKDAGGDAVASDDMIVVRDYPENLDKVRLALKDIDRRPQQILLEATIMSARLNDDNALGVDFNILGGVDFGNFTHANSQILSSGIGAGASGTATGVNNPRSFGTGKAFTEPI